MKIWRGDSDPSNLRKIKFTIPTADGLYTTLINSGDPEAIRRQGIVDSIEKHAHGGWTTSHFLSFSKNQNMAKGFAVGHSGKTLNPSSQQSWDTVIAEIDIGRLNHVKNISVGIDHYSFQELGLTQTLIQLSILYGVGFENAYKNRRSANWPTTRNIYVIDVYKLLSHLAATGHQVSAQALATSLAEEEVLILPIDPLWGQGGETAQVDLGCVSSISYFKLI